jgi:hypothetical protein
MRNPMLEPVKGDVLGRRGVQRTVVDVRSGIIRSGTFVTSINNRRPGEVVWSGERWRDWAALARVIKRGDRP